MNSCPDAKTIVFLLALLLPSFSILRAEPALRGVSVSTGPELFRYTYEEKGLMKETGTMYGVTAKVACRADNMLGLFDLLQVEGSLARASVDYDSNLSGSIDGIGDTIAELRSLAGIDVSSRGSPVLTLFTGIGYRRLNDSGGGRRTSEGDYFYDRHSSSWYTPVGLVVGSGAKRGWVLGGWFEYDAFLGGTQYSELTDTNNREFSFSGNLENEQHAGFGLRAGLVLTKRFPSFTLALEPFVRYWKIRSSEPGRVRMTENGSVHDELLIEPENATTCCGLAVRLVM
jgi:hypothetical protein